MSNTQILRFAKQYVKDHNIRYKHELETTYQSLAKELRLRGLLDKIGLARHKPHSRRWTGMSDEGIVACGQKAAHRHSLSKPHHFTRKLVFCSSQEKIGESLKNSKLSKIAKKGILKKANGVLEGEKARLEAGKKVFYLELRRGGRLAVFEKIGLGAMLKEIASRGLLHAVLPDYISPRRPGKTPEQMLREAIRFARVNNIHSPSKIRDFLGGKEIYSVLHAKGIWNLFETEFKERHRAPRQ